MKILSWNINGIRACKNDMKKVLDSLDADVICIQETKVTRDMLDEAVAIVDGYNSYFSFSRKRSGYSGVASFCKNGVTPERAEEGLSGQHSAKHSRIVEHYGNLSPFTGDELIALDAEGRACITQHRVRFPDGAEKDLAIINVYCPRFDPGREDRHHYKLRFFALLQTRAEAILDSGSHVIILGDINTTHRAHDRCDSDDEESNKLPSRRWLNQLLWEQNKDPELPKIDPDSEQFPAVTPYTRGGQFVDTFRYLYPDKEGAFTNWCTLTNARATNYGRRLDYILADIELTKSCLVDAWIMPDVDGSDHCPVKIDLCCTPIPANSCPPLCTKFMPEFTGKQQKLSMFFTKKTRDVSNADESGDKIDKTNQNEHHTSKISPGKANTVKRPLEKSANLSPIKKQKSDQKKGAGVGKQASLVSFFSKNNCNTNKDSELKRSESIVATQDIHKYKAGGDGNLRSTEGSRKPNSEVTEKEQASSSSDSQAESDKCSQPLLVKENSSKTSAAWKNLLGGLGPVPSCKGHNEPCVLRMVKKPGPNKGKQFYVCARGEGLKSNPEARCDTFLWVSKKK